ncbi:kynureninase [Parahalioglobus pacificus]|uniref:Kynureninase n=1 Tax=Parahalioglobus pacificus TaxID=930806 RepID=A0A919CIL6_9GAMM|nr:kynureninase [Halioglobus pacificus]NQY02765.1 kynureninase [Halieaceae bacterium]GHD27487.1 kynureninase [Halioglobus pacificus]
MSTNSLEALDSADALAPLRAQFDLPAGVTYLDGNSLGALPRAVREALNQTVDTEWGSDLIASWNKHRWIDLPVTVGEAIAPLVGAAPGQLVCCDSISVNLFKLLATALALRPGRRVILSQGDNFPTDLYMAQGLESLLGQQRCELRTASSDGLLEALDSDVAVMMLTEVNFRTGEKHDMRALTQAAHDAGALVLWDLAHSAGAMPVALDACNVDMAVGCGYKFFNGGPGAPAFLYLAKRHQNAVQQPLTGWMGHRNGFEFSPQYTPGVGVSQYLGGTPGVLGMRALQAALSLFESVSMSAVRDKSLALTETFMARVAEQPSLVAFKCLTPVSPEQRGSQVSLAHPEAFAISQALIDRGIIVDFRAPDIVRFGFAPLYNRFADVAKAVSVLEDVMESRHYEDPKYQVRAKVT